ncbi:Glycosyl hydrolases family 2, sugar binding domain [Planctomycetes bacterium Pla163]|uniref:Glycosyl hydrolases family 2, sugar binding domain n=2 Tax=Rohdeia mirabilis TaxID=2528008 RepID=A0A518D4E9_9BACT|nr:Glycosyl hydrolases family 2, sugar binding domain [Planctomycetes bacterium Pla163]
MLAPMIRTARRTAPRHFRLGLVPALALNLAVVLGSACSTAHHSVASTPRAAFTAIVVMPTLGDGAVLQREDAIDVWGTAPANLDLVVEASWLDAPVPTRSDADGHFEADVPTGPAGGPHRLVVRPARSTTDVAAHAVEDLWLGEVWIASGQSNMEWSVAAARWNGLDQAGYARAVANCADEQLRFFQVPNRTSLEPEQVCTGTWVAVAPETVEGLSAVGLHFARRLRAELDVPIGIVQADWGGTVAEAWTSAEALRAFGGFDADLAKIAEETADPGSQGVALATRQDRWWRGIDASDRGLRERWFARDVDTSDWRAVEAPGDPDGGFDGCMWLRRDVEIPESWAGRDLMLHLGPVDDMDVVWLDGEEVAATKVWNRWNEPRHYRVPREAVRAGKVSVTVLCVDTGGGAGMHGRADEMYLHPVNASSERVELAGPWSYRRGASMGDLGTFPTSNWFGPNTPTALFNGMIAPLERTRVRGAIWYQGESNASRPEQYARLFPAMIEDWRGRFRAADDGLAFPFYYVQIAPFGRGDDGGSWAQLRMAQTAVMPGARGVPERFHRAALAHTGMVVTTDVGNPTDIHPKRKLAVGERLANWALADTYAESLSASDARQARWRALPHRSPEPAGFERAGTALTVTFERTDAANELVTVDGAAPDGFEIAGPDGVFHAASAELVERLAASGGQAVRLTSPAVSEPVSVRFAWASDAMPNLRTRGGLSLGPFVGRADG